MKIIIISDIKGSAHSVIPYGLNLARAMNSEAVVLHMIDPRSNQAKYSSYSDSQSLTPGEPLGHEETYKKEVTLVNTELDKFLSRETSSINYPLKFNTIVKVGSTGDEIEKIVKEETSCLIVVSAEADGAIFETKSEIYEMIKDSKAMCILVPPGKEFREYKKILHPVDFEPKELEKYSDLNFFFDAFDPLVNAVSVATEKNYLDLELKTNSWAKVAKDVFLPAKVKANVLKGKKFADTFISYSIRNEPDLIMMFQRKKTQFRKNFKTEVVGTFIEKTNIPVLYFYRK
jgi:nucleotide-binding universal stress UspA family protein